jgi:hypothetical protein
MYPPVMEIIIKTIGAISCCLIVLLLVLFGHNPIHLVRICDVNGTGWQ